jgi:hypothetical protein
VPLSEIRQKEAFYEAHTWFSDLISGQQGELKNAVQNRMTLLMGQYGIDPRN